MQRVSPGTAAHCPREVGCARSARRTRSREVNMNVELGSPVLDSSGKKLGDVDGIVVDAGTKRARAIVVNTGLFGRSRHIVELSAISSSDDAGLHLDASGATTDKESPVLDSVEVADPQ